MFYKKRWFYLFIVLPLVLIGLWIWWSNRKVDGSNGGKIEGPSHEQGGINTVIKSNGETISVEGNEDILTKRVNEIKDQYTCQGTPSGIASALNVEAGGVKFADGGSCRITRIPIQRMSTRKK